MRFAITIQRLRKYRVRIMLVVWVALWFILDPYGHKYIGWKLWLTVVVLILGSSGLGYLVTSEVIRGWKRKL